MSRCKECGACSIQYCHGKPMVEGESEFKAGAEAMKAAIKAQMRPFTWHAMGLDGLTVEPAATKGESR